MAGIDITPDAQGKVRDLYDLGDRLLLVATDRISAFDYILEDEIPHKGQVLTQLSKFWFNLLDGVVENHLISTDVADLPEQFQPYADYLRGRFMLVRKADMFPAECIVRGYLAGSGLKEYNREGTVCGIELPEGLVNSSKLPEPIFTPSTKAEIGDHDENISFERCAELIGDDDATALRDLALAVYTAARDHAAARGVIIADTKFEFGVIDGKIILADEPVSALDVTIQAQILELMRSLQKEFGMSILFITHDLGTVANMCDNVAVMYLGQIVEYGTVRQIFHDPRHPYTKGLLRSLPKMDQNRGDKLFVIDGVVPLPVDLPPSCGFHDRCPSRIEGVCACRDIAEYEAEPGHMVRCALMEEKG